MLPKLYSIPVKSNMTIDKFKGINLTNSYEPGELCDCVNIDSAAYPAIASRKKRTVCSQCDGTINGVGCFDGYFYTYASESADSIFLRFKENDYEFTLFTDSEDYTAKRSFAYLENSILIMPDNVIFFTDTLKFKKVHVYQKFNFASADEKIFNETHDTTIQPFGKTHSIGRVLSDRICSLAYPYSVYSTGQKYYYPVEFTDKLEIGDIITLKIEAYSDATSSSDTAMDFYSMFQRTHTLKIVDLKKSELKSLYVENRMQITEVIFEPNSFDISRFGEVYFSEITIEKKPPDLSMVTSYNNRIWGTYGGKVYASRLGDADEWNDFSRDSYGTLPSASFCASAGTDGDFTAIIPHGNYIYALKENYIHKIYGDSPDEYTISNLEAPGCIKGADTACVCGIYLMYASRDGICVLRDGYPRIVSEKIGRLNPICAAAQNGKYYILCRDGGKKVIYVYDLEHDIWTKEACSEDADNLCSDMGSVCYSQKGSLIYLTEEDGAEFEKDVKWNFKLRFDPGKSFKNTPVRAIARISLEKNSSFTSRVIYDDGTKSAICGFCYDETQHGSASLNLPLKRDLGFSLEFKGTGSFTLRNIKFSYYKSSEE